MNIFKKIPAVIASVAVIVSLSAVAVSANSYVPEVSDVVTEDMRSFLILQQKHSVSRHSR